MRTGAASAVGARRHNENDVTMTTDGLWRYGDWRHVATGCTALATHYTGVKLPLSTAVDSDHAVISSIVDLTKDLNCKLFNVNSL